MAASSRFSIPPCLGALHSSEHLKPPDPAASSQISLDLLPSRFQLLCFSAVCKQSLLLLLILGLRHLRQTNKTKCLMLECNLLCLSESSDLLA